MVRRISVRSSEPTGRQRRHSEPIRSEQSGTFSSGTDSPGDGSSGGPADGVPGVQSTIRTVSC